MTNIKKGKKNVVWNVCNLNSRPAAETALVSLSGFGFGVLFAVDF